MNYLRKVVGANLASPRMSIAGRLVMIMMRRRNDYLERCAVECCNISPGDKVLEVGFGHGLGLKYACEKITTGKVYGLDISDLSMQEAEELLHEDISQKKVELYQTPVNNIPINSEYLDSAFSCNSFYFWPNIPTACAELLRVLKPGGRLLAVQNIDNILKRKRAGGFNHANTDFAAYMATLEAVGFSDVNIEYLTDHVTKKPYQCISATAS